MTDPHLVKPGDAPTPFSAAQIRDGCREGRTVTSVTTSGGVETTSMSRFSECDTEGATITRDGQARQVTWRDLQTHASFPAESTAIANETISTPLGELECLRYVMTSEDGTHTFWFDIARPGMPVSHKLERDGEIITATVVTADEQT